MQLLPLRNALSAFYLVPLRDNTISVPSQISGLTLSLATKFDGITKKDRKFKIGYPAKEIAQYKNSIPLKQFKITKFHYILKQQQTRRLKEKASNRTKSTFFIPSEINIRSLLTTNPNQQKLWVDRSQGSTKPSTFRILKSNILIKVIPQTYTNISGDQWLALTRLIKPKLKNVFCTSIQDVKLNFINKKVIPFTIKNLKSIKNVWEDTRSYNTFLRKTIYTFLFPLYQTCRLSLTDINLNKINSQSGNYISDTPIFTFSFKKISKIGKQQYDFFLESFKSPITSKDIILVNNNIAIEEAIPYWLKYYNLKKSNNSYLKYTQNLNINNRVAIHQSYISYLEVSKFTSFKLQLLQNIGSYKIKATGQTTEYTSVMKSPLKAFKSRFRWLSRYIAKRKDQKVFIYSWFNFFFTKNPQIIAKLLKLLFEQTPFKKHRLILVKLKILVKSFIHSIRTQYKFIGVYLKVKGKIGVGGNAKKRHITLSSGGTSNSHLNIKLSRETWITRTDTGVLFNQLKIAYY